MFLCRSLFINICLVIIALLWVKRVPTPKGWTIMVDSCIPHAGAAARHGNPGGGYAASVYRAIDRVLPGLEGEQDHTVNIRSMENPYFLMMFWAQTQATALFAPAPTV